MNIAQIALAAMGAAMLLTLVAYAALPKGGSRPGSRGRGGKGASAQDAMPLSAIAGKYAWLKDGSYRAYLRWPGRNQSIDTDAERLARAYALSDALATIDVRFSIMKLPERASSTDQLDDVDRAVDAARGELMRAEPGPQADAARLRLGLLEGCFKEEAIAEATGSGRLSWPTYVALDFPAGTDVALADQKVANLVRMAAKTLGDRPEVLDERGIRRLYQLYFTPSTVSADAAPAGTVVMPDYGVFAKG